MGIDVRSALREWKMPTLNLGREENDMIVVALAEVEKR